MAGTGNIISVEIPLKVILFIAYLFWGMMISLQPPFYPAEATKKGATPSQVIKAAISNYSPLIIIMHF